MSQVAALTVALEGSRHSLWPAALGAPVDAVVAAASGAIAVPLLVDVALAVLRPVEDLLAQRYVGRASAVLARARPLVVGITGLLRQDDHEELRRPPCSQSSQRRREPTQLQQPRRTRAYGQ